MQERYATNKPLLFKRIKYDYWMEMMIAHFDSLHIDIWDIVENGNHIPYDVQLNEIPRSEWTKEQKYRFMLNFKARYALLCAFSKEEYTKFHYFVSVKQMQDTLAITYEGSTQVKRNKLSLLTHKYELFTMEEGEEIQCMFGCLQTILNELRSLGITLDNYDHIDKILGSLSKKWSPQVTPLRG